MSDRELLELAAKAAGKGLQWCELWGCMAKWLNVVDGFDRDTCWRPLQDDGDALRLAVALELEEICWFTFSVTVKDIGICSTEDFNGDPLAATRRAIVRAAAAIAQRGGESGK